MELKSYFPPQELQGTYPADSKKLFIFLGVDSKYADWITNRIFQYGFIENQDYVIEIISTKGRPRKEYRLTLDMAKELCMVENNDKGREARRYFIKCEKELYRLSNYQTERENIELKRAINRLTITSPKLVDFDGLNQILQRNIGTLLINADRQIAEIQERTRKDIYTNTHNILITFQRNSQNRKLTHKDKKC